MKLTFGAKDDVLELLHQMAEGKGFGVEVGQGITMAQKEVDRGIWGGSPDSSRISAWKSKGLEVTNM